MYVQSGSNQQCFVYYSELARHHQPMCLKLYLHITCKANDFILLKAKVYSKNIKLKQSHM